MLPDRRDADVVEGNVAVKGKGAAKKKTAAAKKRVAKKEKKASESCSHKTSPSVVLKLWGSLSPLGAA